MTSMFHYLVLVVTKAIHRENMRGSNMPAFLGQDCKPMLNQAWSLGHDNRPGANQSGQVVVSEKVMVYSQDNAKYLRK